MTSYSWKIQLIDFYPDQFQENGKIEAEKAIEEFQLFPWDKEIYDFKRKEETPNIPKIIFTSDNQRELIISSVSLKGFNLEYSNLVAKKHSEFYISNDFEKSNWTVEEMIGFFFEETIELKINLSDIEEEKINVEIPKQRRKAKNVEFLYNPNHLKSIGFPPLFWFVFSISCFIAEFIYKIDIPIIVHAILVFIWGLPMFVHLTYMLKNKNSKVIIDTSNHELTYIKGDKEKKFTRDDIYNCFVITCTNRKSFMTNYSYVWFVLNDRSYVIITSFVTDPYEIVESLNCKYIERVKSAPTLPMF